MKSYWIWNYGDYEIFHSNRVNARRQEFGVDYPTFWKYYDVDRIVRFYAEIETEIDGNIKLFLNGKGYILVDGQRYGSETVIFLKKRKAYTSNIGCEPYRTSGSVYRKRRMLNK